ncbi:AAA family ATPase [Paenibacillus sp. FSL R7-0179]|uniref:AAA family ATPase n=1 Tax=Paenibacillus sp. FSL R7-0179 TaxID=2921672 RepID=UPI0030F9E4C4
MVSGKTQTAAELHRRIPNSYVFDPENAGYYIRDNIPAEMAEDDFQKHYLWREFTYSMLKCIYSEYEETIIVPMTLVDPDYFIEIVGRLRSEGRQVRHFTLYASPETLLDRLKSRGEGRDSWAALQMQRCLEGLKNKVFEHHVDTEYQLISQVAEVIIAMIETED